MTQELGTWTAPQAVALGLTEDARNAINSGSDGIIFS